MRRPSRVAASLAASLLLVGCGAGGLSRIGVSRNGPNGVRIHFIPCPGEAVTRVAFLGKAEEGFSIGGDEPGDPEDDEFPAWQAGTGGASAAIAVDVGTTPPGFVEEIPLSEPVEEVDGGHAAFIGFDRDGLRSAQMGFDLDELEPTRIFTDDGTVSPEAFEQAAKADCEG